MYWHVRRLLPLPAVPILVFTVSAGVYVAGTAAFVPSLAQYHSARSPPLQRVHHDHNNGYARSSTPDEGRRRPYHAHDRDGRMLTGWSRLRRTYLSSWSRRRAHSREGDGDNQCVFWEAVEKVGAPISRGAGDVLHLTVTALS